MSTHAVKKRVQAGPASKRIPRYYRVYGVVRFNPVEVRRWLDEKAVG